MSRHRTLLALTALSATFTPAFAQRQCVATHDDNTLKTNTSMGGPNLLLGIRWQAPTTMPITAIHVITGNRPGPNAVSIWSHDAAGDKPSAILGGRGTWQSDALVRWQGASLPQPVIVMQGSVYWIVWEPQNGAQASLSTAAGTLPYRGSFDGGQTWNGQNSGQNPWPPNAWKLRLFCTSGTGTINAYGTGKAGSGSLVPALAVEGFPTIGNQLQLVVSNAQPSAPAFLVLGVRSALPIGIGTLYATPLVIGTTQTSTGRVPGAGAAVIPLGIPNDPSLANVMFAVQWWILDPGATFQFAHTDGSEVTIK